VRKRVKHNILGEYAEINQEEEKHEEVQPMAAKSTSSGTNIIGNHEVLVGGSFAPRNVSSIVDPNQTSQFRYGQSTPTQ
jgi:hypothetical protein|tara:strand:- start:210 stop:446 length:237 start_codon:yes stop_codon:yes gene_type:complete